MDFDSAYLVYGVAVAWFTYHMCWMVMRIYQFSAFPRTYGVTPNLSLHDLGEAALIEHRELPAFRLVVPAFQEVEVIEATLRRAASINYPRTHFEIVVVTYADEPPRADRSTTFDVAQRVAEEVNRDARLELVRVLRVPAGYDGYFPGNLDSPVRHIGKARGLNYALRWMHAANERSERALYIGLMERLGPRRRVDSALDTLAAGVARGATVTPLVTAWFDPQSPDFLGPLSLSRQLATLANIAGALRAHGSDYARECSLLSAYIESEAPRFFLEARRSTTSSGELSLQVAEDKRFLHEVMCEVEGSSPEILEARTDAVLKTLERMRPLLHAELQRARSGEEVFQLARRVNARWVMVYDADADPPPDVMRHLAARILTEPDVMGFQGPVAPLLNYEEVHPLCRMGALWMAFWHGAAYPRLLHNKYWAHPLAGTNWCFRIEGFEHNSRLIRHCRYDEARRRFLLHFDPTQLTEDLEAGVRNFSEWAINAEWHPLVEMEQVPPTPQTMFRQHARWALGTLQTMAYVMRSRLPWTQKTWFLMYPMRVIFASSGPFITLALVLAVAAGVVKIVPLFAWWTLALACGNVVYVLAFSRTFERYYDMHQRAAAVDYLIQNGRELVSQMRSAAVTGSETGAAIEHATRRLREGIEPGGFAQRYLASRCTDDATPGDTFPGVVEYVAHLRRETPCVLQRDVVARFLRALDTPADDTRAAGSPKCTGSGENWAQLARLVERASTSAGAGRRPRWSRFHTQILVWSIPFIYFSVTPFFSAFWRWSTGQRGGWNKTMRTPKLLHAARTDMT